MKRHGPEENIMERTLELQELAEAYVTGGLSDEERHHVEARLVGGDRALQHAIDAVEQTLALLGSSVRPVPPPPEVKPRLFDTLRAMESEQRSTPALALEAMTPALDPDSDLQALHEVFQNMRRRVPGERVPTAPARRAVLVIDMLHDYVDEDSPMEVPLARAIVPSLERLLEQERAKGTPIIYINDVHDDDDPDFDVWPSHAVRGTFGSEVIPPLRPRGQDMVVERISYSAFFETRLEEILKRLGVTDLVLTGQAADACVMMTAVDALMRGFIVEVPEDCVAGVTPEGKTFALRRIGMLKPYQPKRKR